MLNSEVRQTFCNMEAPVSSRIDANNDGYGEETWCILFAKFSWRSFSRTALCQTVGGLTSLKPTPGGDKKQRPWAGTKCITQLTAAIGTWSWFAFETPRRGHNGIIFYCWLILQQGRDWIGPRRDKWWTAVPKYPYSSICWFPFINAALRQTRNVTAGCSRKLRQQQQQQQKTCAEICCVSRRCMALETRHRQVSAHQMRRIFFLTHLSCDSLLNERYQLLVSSAGQVAKAAEVAE